ncbi:hypothetical protein [Planctomycetes bacterium K23_9]|uniref:WXG100 family type VII secretion target n=1 Tax=Stieleria marina TaxID=1930275 RepID=A0A517P2L5_9BACT|nr:hypothetical protein K239x_56370 [Planctomycetes bacterium K23_9]
MSFQLGTLTDAESRFKRDFIEFAKLWADVKEDWRDDRCRRFEQEHLASLGPSLNRFTAGLNELTNKIRQADRALADEGPSPDQL